MKQKRKSIGNVGSVIVSILIGIFMYNVLNGLNLTFQGFSQSSLRSKFSSVHFSALGNNFGGGIIWLEADSANENISFAGSPGVSKTCKARLRGIYYNMARGLRVWPLDQKTLTLLKDTFGGGSSYGSLSMTGGLYTACGNTDPYGIYGSIQYTIAGTTPLKSYLIAGTKLDYQGNDFIAQFANSFENFNNDTPLGYIWDSIGGIGFVGGQMGCTGANYISGSNQNLITYINSGGSISSAFRLEGAGDDKFLASNQTGNWCAIMPNRSQIMDTMRDILVQGNVILSKNIEVDQRRTILGNPEKRTVLINSDINSATVINLAKKNTEILCRAKTPITENTPQVDFSSSIQGKDQEKILCYNNIGDLRIDLDKTDFAGKTIIMKSGNVTLHNTVPNSTAADPAYLDIFVDEGALFIENPTDNGKTTFNEDGYPSTTDITNSGIFIKGNLIVNGLIMGKDKLTWNITGVSNKVHILGKMASLNTPYANELRSAQIYSVLGNYYSGWINLENVFTWKCNFGQGSDGTSCLGNSAVVERPLVVLNANFPSNVLR